MSGGSGPSIDWRPEPKHTGGGEGGTGGEDPCAVDEIVGLSSPQPTVLATVKIGDILTIVLNGKALEVHALAGIAGVITSPSMLQIIKCMTHSSEVYIAEVVQLNKGICRARVRRP